jgi:hypothetical protein
LGKADIAFCGAHVCFDPKRTSILAQQRRRERGPGQSARRDIFGLYKPNVATLYLGPLRPVSAVDSVNERNLIFGRLAAGVVAAQLNLMYGDKNKCHSGRGWLGNGHAMELMFAAAASTSPNSVAACGTSRTRAAAAPVAAPSFQFYIVGMVSRSPPRPTIGPPVGGLIFSGFL